MQFPVPSMPLNLGTAWGIREAAWSWGLGFGASLLTILIVTYIATVTVVPVFLIRGLIANDLDATLAWTSARSYWPVSGHAAGAVAANFQSEGLSSENAICTGPSHG